MIAKRLRSLTLTCGFALAFGMLTFQIVWANAEIKSTSFLQGGVPTVDIQSDAGGPIEFWTFNGDPKKGTAQRFVPHLILHGENGLMTPSVSRTITITASNILVNPGITATIEITVSTQEGDPDLGGNHNFAPQIPVWHESQTRTIPIGVPAAPTSVIFSHEFTESILYNGVLTTTPTDYFRVEVYVDGLLVPPPYDPDYAFLMENQWTQPLPPVNRDTPDAGPQKLILYYADMFPFGTNSADRSTWLPRVDVSTYVTQTLALSMSQVSKEETDDWGMDPWHAEWTSWRGEKRLSVALNDGATWFHEATGQYTIYGGDYTKFVL